MSGTNYTLRVVNESDSLWDMCVYQVDPDIGIPNVMSLAWFSKSAHPTTSVTFRWSLDYSFVWSETGQLMPGVFFDATQTWQADPATNSPATSAKPGNQVGFARQDEAFTFTPTATPGAQAGSLYIKQDAKIPNNKASVGIGMSGSGTFAVQAKPNVNLNFTPHPVYWLAAGSFSQGEVLDIGAINNPTSVRFPANVYSMTAILDESNAWIVKPTSQVNAQEYRRSAGPRHNQMAKSR